MVSDVGYVYQKVQFSVNLKLCLCNCLVVWPVCLASYRDEGHLSTSSLVDAISDAINVDSAASMPNFAFIAATIFHYHHFMSD